MKFTPKKKTLKTGITYELFYENNKMEAHNFQTACLSFRPPKNAHNSGC